MRSRYIIWLAIVAMHGWRDSFYVLGALSLVWTVFFVWLFRNSPVEHAWVNLLRRGRGQRAGQPLRRDLQRRLAAPDRQAHHGPFPVNQLGGRPGADHHDAVPGHERLDGEQRAVGRPQDEQVVCHDQASSRVAPRCVVVVDTVAARFSPGCAAAHRTNPRCRK